MVLSTFLGAKQVQFQTILFSIVYHLHSLPSMKP